MSEFTVNDVGIKMKETNDSKPVKLRKSSDWFLEIKVVIAFIVSNLIRRARKVHRHYCRKWQLRRKESTALVSAALPN